MILNQDRLWKRDLCAVLKGDRADHVNGVPIRTGTVSVLAELFSPLLRLSSP